MSRTSEVTRKIESSPIHEEEGKWIVHFAENGQSIGIVEVHNGYTASGWDESPTANVTTDLQIECEKHAVEQFEAMMLGNVRQIMLAQMPPGSNVEVFGVKRCL